MLKATIHVKGKTTMSLISRIFQWIIIAHSIETNFLLQLLQMFMVKFYRGKYDDLDPAKKMKLKKAS